VRRLLILNSHAQPAGDGGRPCGWPEDGCWSPPPIGRIRWSAELAPEGAAAPTGMPLDRDLGHAAAGGPIWCAWIARPGLHHPEGCRRRALALGLDDQRSQRQRRIGDPRMASAALGAACGAAVAARDPADRLAAAPWPVAETAGIERRTGRPWKSSAALLGETTSAALVRLDFR